MKATISKNKKRITLENGTFFTIGKDETAADFIMRVEDEVKETLMEELEFNKKAEKATVTPGEKDSKDAEIKAQLEADKIAREEEKARKAEEKAEAKRIAAEEKAEAKRIAAEEKAAEKERIAKEKAEAKERAEAEKAAEAERKEAERMELLKEKADEVIAQGEVDAQKFLEDAAVKAEEIKEAARVRAEKMLTSKSDGAGLDQGLIEFVKSQKGKKVEFIPFGSTEPTEGEIVGVMVDRRVDGVFFKIKNAEGKISHKNAANPELVNILD